MTTVTADQVQWARRVMRDGTIFDDDPHEARLAREQAVDIIERAVEQSAQSPAADIARIAAQLLRVNSDLHEDRETAHGSDSNDDLLTLKEAREFAKIKRTTCWKWVDQLGLRTVTVHGIKRVRRGDLQEFLRRHESGKTGKRSK